jgi:hypothetical protein
MTETEEQRRARLEAKEQKRLQNREAWSQKTRASAGWNRWQDHWFSTTGDWPWNHYADILLSSKLLKRKFDEHLDTLVASSRIKAVTDKEMDAMWVKKVTELVHEIVVEAGDDGIDDEGLVRKVKSKLAELKIPWSDENFEGMVQ